MSIELSQADKAACWDMLKLKYRQAEKLTGKSSKNLEHMLNSEQVVKEYGIKEFLEIHQKAIKIMDKLSEETPNDKD